MRWRQMIAHLAGFPPLMLMEGFCEIRGKFTWDEFGEISAFIPMSKRYDEKHPVSYALEIIKNGFVMGFHELPLKWDYYKDDPLSILLMHSDCDGEIDAKDCEPIADRLESLIPHLPDEPDTGHISDWKKTTQAFVDGLRAAAAANENVDFH